VNVAALTLTRDLPDRSRVVAKLAIVKHDGNAHPYFSLTGALYYAHGTWSGAACQRNGRSADAYGQLTGDIVQAFPDNEAVAAFQRMHMSEYPSGAPMYAAANGRYHAERGNREWSALLLRCDVADLPETLDAEAWEAFCAAQADRWAREAAEAAALIGYTPEAGSC
jgi:hypothetical protein